MKTTITKAQTYHVNVVSDLFCSVIDSMPGMNDEARAEDKAAFTGPCLKQKIQDRDWSVLISVTDGEISGFCIGCRTDEFFYKDAGFDNPTQKGFWMMWIGVGEAFRGPSKKGQPSIANQLLSAMEEEAASFEAERLECVSLANNFAAHSLLKKAGWHPAGAATCEGGLDYVRIQKPFGQKQPATAHRREAAVVEPMAAAL